MFINPVYLKYFCDAAALGGISASAKKNFVTQSAVSQAIAKLESHLQVSLLSHAPNTFRLTPIGEAVYQEGLKLLKQLSVFQENIFEEGRENIGTLSFACTYSFASTVIPKYLCLFREKYPEVKIEFLLGKNEEILKMLKSGQIDFGILPDEGHLQKFDTCILNKGKLACFISKKVPKSKKKDLLYILSKSSSYEMALFHQLYKKKFKEEPSSVLEVHSWEIISTLVEEGLGIGYFPDYILEKKGSNLVKYDIGLKDQDYTIKAVFLKNFSLRKSSKIFIELLTNNHILHLI